MLYITYVSIYIATFYYIIIFHYYSAIDVMFNDVINFSINFILPWLGFNLTKSSNESCLLGYFKSRPSCPLVT